MLALVPSTHLTMLWLTSNSWPHPHHPTSGLLSLQSSRDDGMRALIVHQWQPSVDQMLFSLQTNLLTTISSSTASSMSQSLDGWGPAQVSLEYHPPSPAPRELLVLGVVGATQSGSPVDGNGKDYHGSLNSNKDLLPSVQLPLCPLQLTNLLVFFFFGTKVDSQCGSRSHLKQMDLACSLLGGHLLVQLGFPTLNFDDLLLSSSRARVLAS